LSTTGPVVSSIPREKVLCSLVDDIVAVADGIAVGEQDGAGEVSIVGGSTGSPGVRTSSSKSSREFSVGVATGVETANNGVRFKFEGCAEGITGVEGEESPECARGA
jgi:hypothetical protein